MHNSFFINLCTYLVKIYNKSMEYSGQKKYNNGVGSYYTDTKEEGTNESGYI